jgi:hypothetical protein
MFLWAVMTATTAGAEAVPYAADTGISWWQTIGGLVLVFGLLIVSLKLLGKWNRRTGGADTNLMTVWHLGPKREIQLLRLGDEVHYIYRHDGSMVVLKKEPWADFERKKAAEAAAG